MEDIAIVGAFRPSNVMDGVGKGSQRMGLPSGPRGPMEDHPAGWPVPFRSAHLLNLVLDDLVGPNPIEEIEEPWILRFQREGIGAKRGGGVKARTEVLAMLSPLSV